MRGRDIVKVLEAKLLGLRNALLSRHDPQERANCHQCGKKPKQYYSHSGAWIVCKCGQMIYTGLGNSSDIRELWDRMNEQKEKTQKSS